MKKIHVLLLSVLVLGGFSSWAEEGKRPANEQVAAEENLTAAQILKACTRIIPTEPILLKGTLTVRKLRGIVLAEYPFKLLMEWGANPPTAECLLLDPKGTSLVERAVLTRPVGQLAQIKLYSGPEQKPEDPPVYSARIRGTDMTWLDLTMDFLWWKDVRLDDTPRGDSRTGRDCDIVVVVPPGPIPGCSAMRVWVDRQLRCVMQAEQLDPQGNPVRKMWVQQVKKIDDRWMIRDMEIETLNSGHRTRLFVDEATSP